MGRLDQAAGLWVGVDEASFKLRQVLARYHAAGDKEGVARAEKVLEQVESKE